MTYATEIEVYKRQEENVSNPLLVNFRAIVQDNKDKLIILKLQHQFCITTSPFP